MNDSNAALQSVADFQSSDPSSSALDGVGIEGFTPTTSNVEKKNNTGTKFFHSSKGDLNTFTEDSIKHAVIAALEEPTVIQILSNSIVTALKSKNPNHKNETMTLSSPYSTATIEERAKYWKHKYQKEHRENNLLRAVQHIERVANRTKRKKSSRATTMLRARPTRDTIHSIAASAAAAAAAAASSSRKRCRVEPLSEHGFERDKEAVSRISTTSRPLAMKSSTFKSSHQKETSNYDNDCAVDLNVCEHSTRRNSGVSSITSHNKRNKLRPRNVSLSPKNIKDAEMRIPDSDEENDTEIDLMKRQNENIDETKDKMKAAEPNSVGMEAALGFTNAGTGKAIEVSSEGLNAAAAILSTKQKGRRGSERNLITYSAFFNQGKSNIKAHAANAARTRNVAQSTDQALGNGSAKSSSTFSKCLPANETIAGEPSVESPKFAYCEVVRKKDERAVLPAYTCLECQAFANAMVSSKNRDGTNVFNSLDIVQACSRHRSRFTPPKTPKGFWELSFVDER